MPLMAPGLTLNAYKGVLRALFPILHTWELWAAQHAPDSFEPLLASRRRSHLLREDLHFLGDEAVPAMAEEGAINWDRVTGGESQLRDSGEFAAAYFGAVYVVEGSTLGGRLIARHVEPWLGLNDGQGAAYFRGHGEKTGALWHATAQAISAVPERYAEILIASARRTFQTFRAALVTMPPPDTSTSPHE